MLYEAPKRPGGSGADFEDFKRVCSAMRRLISSAYHRLALPALENDLAELWVLWRCNTPEASWSIQWLYLQYLVGQMRKIPNGEVSAWATERWYGHMVDGVQAERREVLASQDGDVSKAISNI